MPNWCDTTYICDGSKRQLIQLYNNNRIKNSIRKNATAFYNE